MCIDEAWQHVFSTKVDVAIGYAIKGLLALVDFDDAARRSIYCDGCILLPCLFLRVEQGRSVHRELLVHR